MTDFEKIVTGLITLLDELKQKNAKNRPERLAPCKCGCKRREHWYGAKNSEDSRILKCCKCGFTVSGRSEIEVHRKWNEAVENNGTS